MAQIRKFPSEKYTKKRETDDNEGNKKEEDNEAIHQPKFVSGKYENEFEENVIKTMKKKKNWSDREEKTRKRDNTKIIFFSEYKQTQT